MSTFRACLVSAVAILAFGDEPTRPRRITGAAAAGKVTAKFSPPSAAKGEVALTFDTGRELTLPQVMSADGGRYANAGIEFWIKGRSATLTMNGVKETCSTR